MKDIPELKPISAIDLLNMTDEEINAGHKKHVEEKVRKMKSKKYYPMNLNLFAISVPDAVKELCEEERNITYTPPERTSAAIQAAYLQYIEENTSEMRAHMEEDDFIRMMDAVPYNSELLESIDKTLKEISKSLKLIAGRL